MRVLRIAFWIVIIVAVLFTIALFSMSPQSARANPGTNINATTTEHYAWNDVMGWIDFYGTDTITVWGTRLEGYASSSFGEVSLDCSTSPSGNICSTSNYGICNGIGPHNTDGTCPNADGSGELTGFAWNDNIGWISFNCDQTDHGGTNHCSDSDYGITIDSSGNFVGYAWNDITGWVNMNGALHKVATAWRATSTVGYLDSVIFDTNQQNGAVLNSIRWTGDTQEGTYVDFQIAVASSTDGPWVFRGPGGDTGSYYGLPCESSFVGGVNVGGAPEDTAICVDPSQVNNYRYFRYRVRLRSNVLQTLTPQIDDIILNWSR